MPIEVLVIDSKPIVQLGLRSAVDDIADIEVIGEAENGLEGVKRFKELRPDVTLISLRLPDMCAADDIGTFFEIDPEAKIVVLAESAGDAEIRASVDGGALGFISASAATSVVLEAIRSTYAGSQYFDESVSQTLKTEVLAEELTPAETDVLEKLVVGLSNREIAFALDVSENTVKTHIRHIFEKLGVTDRTTATVTAIKRGLVRVDI